MTIDPAQLAEKITAIDEATGHGVAGGPNYNVAPTATIAVVVSRHGQPGDQPTRRVRAMRWGLVPPWAKPGPAGGLEGQRPQLINARADKIITSPAFRSSAQSRRCLVPMDGFYEWRVANDLPSGMKRRKTPFYIYREDGEPLFVAGLWSVWRPAPAAPPLLSCAIITTGAVGELAGIHDRMPLLVPEGDWDRWLDPDAPPDTELLVRPPEVSGVRIREVATLVNNVRNNGPELIEPVGPRRESPTLL